MAIARPRIALLLPFAEINWIKKVHPVFALCITSLFWIMLAALIIALALLCTLHAFQLHNPQIFQRRSAIFLSDVEDGVEVSDGEVKLHQVFVGNLPFDIEEEQLTSLVSEKAGSSFASLRLARDRRTGRSRGFGYIDYEDKAEAEAAIGKLVGLELGGRELKIDFSEPRPERPRSDRPPQDNSVFIGNLDFSVGEDQILEMCNDILGDGVASRVRLATDRETGRPRGFGHIDFVSADEAIRAVNELGGVSLLGRELRVDHARRKEDGDAAAPRREFSDRAPRQSGGGAAAGGNRDHSIFLGNLAWEVTPELVEEMLDDVLGPNLFLQVRLATDRETGRPRGFGHVDFKDAESAERALVELNGLEVMGRQLRVDMAQRRVPGEGGEGGGGGYGGGGGGRGGGGGGRGGGGGGGYRGGGEDIGSFGAF